MMYKKFFEGLLFGAGFTISMISIVWLYTYLTIQNTVNSINEEPYSLGNSSSIESNNVDNVVPPVVEDNQYLGSTAIYSSRFNSDTGAILGGGNAKIVGKVTANGKPLQGVTLRLALNGSHMSQWGVSDEKGRYEIPVPIGEYRVDGFRLQTGFNDGLSGLILHPHMASSSRGTFRVDENKIGEGLTLRFVTPVAKISQHDVFRVNDDIVLEWEDYPDADLYEVQVLEKKAPHSFKTKRLFEWSEQPKVYSSKFDLTHHNLELKENHYYIFKVRAIKSDTYEVLSETDNDIRDYDFKVVGK